MKISNSKKQLAKIISENGGWPDAAEFAVQRRETMLVGFSKTMPYRRGCGWFVKGETPVATFKAGRVITNWHQTILSRDEYFHLYPVPDDDGWVEWKGGECPVEHGVMVDVRHRDGEEFNGTIAGRKGSDGYAERWTHDGYFSDIIAYRRNNPEQSSAEQCIAESFEPTPTIEQLAADYRAKLAIAHQAQEEADSHRCGAEAALDKLAAAGKDLGLVLSVADVASSATKFTGKFHSEKYGDRPDDLDMICDGCGNRFGYHVGFNCRP